ncbi:unnamed protein product [Cochlearia groenlandica]
MASQSVAQRHTAIESLRPGRSDQSIVGRLLCLWDSKNVKKQGEFMGITLLLLGEKVRNVSVMWYEAAFNGFVDEINAIAAYQWWEGAIYIMLAVLVYPLAWSWQQSRRRLKFQKVRDIVRSEYDHSCLRSCRSRTLYEGLKVAATSDLMLTQLDFFLGGDEKRNDLPFKFKEEEHRKVEEEEEHMKLEEEENQRKLEEDRKLRNFE